MGLVTVCFFDTNEMERATKFGTGTGAGQFLKAPV